MAGCDDMDVLPLSETSLGEETVDKPDDNILQDSVSGQAALFAGDNVQEFVKDGDSLRSWDCSDKASVGTPRPDTGLCGPCLPNCSVILMEEETDGVSDCSQGILTGVGDQFCSSQVQAVRHLEDIERDVRDVFSQKEDVREAVEGTQGDVTEVFSQKEDVTEVFSQKEDVIEAVEGTEGDVTEMFSQKEDVTEVFSQKEDVTEVFSQKEDVREAVEGTEGDITEVFSQKEDVTEVFSQKEDVREAVEGTEGGITEVFNQKEDVTEGFSQKEDVREAVEGTEGDVTEVFNQKGEDIRKGVEDTEADVEDILCQENNGCGILDIDCSVKSDSVTVRESDKQCGANNIQVAEVEPVRKVQGSSVEKVFRQNKNDDPVPGVCVWKEDVAAKAKADVDFYEPTGENNVTETAFVSPVFRGFGNIGNIGKTECTEEVTLLNEDVESFKDAQQCHIPLQPGGGCSTDASYGDGLVSCDIGALADQQDHYKMAAGEEKTGGLDESLEHSFNTVKQVLMICTHDTDCVLQTDDQHAADQTDENSEWRVKSVACGADSDDCAVGGEVTLLTRSASNDAECVGISVGADTAAPHEYLGDDPVVCGDSQPHFDLSGTFNIFAEEEQLDHFITENNDQCVSSHDVPSVVNVRQNAVSAQAKKRKKERAKLEKLLSRNTTSRAARVRRYAASFQELLANKEDTFHPDFTCPVCLDLYHKPHVVHPCQHMFCEPCLRKLPSSALADNAVCPLCRQDIRACVMDVDLHIQLSEYYRDIYTKRARQEKKLKTNQRPLPHIQTRPLSQQLIRHILSSQSNRRSDGNVLHMVLSMCLSAVLSVLYVWMNVPIEITSGPLRNAAVSNVWVQAICLFCALMWLFVKGLGKLVTRERR